MSALVAKELQEQNKLLEQLIGNYILDKIHPVGSIYISENSTSPATLFGGTWERVKDRFLLAAGDTYSAGSTGGEAKHTLSIEEMPSHNHTITSLYSGDGGLATDGFTLQRGYYGKAVNVAQISENFGISNNGGNMPHNNMPPYLAVYMWRRIS